MGQYCYEEKYDCYVQKNTEKTEEMYVPRYLFSLNDVWAASDTPFDKSGWLYNPSSSKSLPSTGWWFHDGRMWRQDQTLEITNSPMTSLCDNIEVTISGDAKSKLSLCEGEFTRTEMWWHGRPVFRNENNQLLNQSPEQGWCVGGKLGFAFIIGSMSHDCPASEKSWKYWDTSQYKPADVKIVCKVHK